MLFSLKRKVLLTSAVLCCFSSVSNASTIIIDFEGYAAGTIIDNEYAPAMVTSAINVSSGPDVAVIFDTLNPSGGDIDLGGPFSTNNPLLSNNYNPGNVLIIQENSAGCDAFTCSEPDDEGSRPAGGFIFEFESAVNLLSIDFFDVEGEETVFNAIKLFDVNNVEIMPGVFFTPDTGGDNMWDRVMFNAYGVKMIELNMGGSGAIDNIAYNAVPVPAAVWLFGTGLLSLVGVARRK
jgi:hypothetical protein